VAKKTKPEPKAKTRCAYQKMVPIAELLPNPKNRNRHPAEQIARLAQIIEYQGFRHPIVVSLLSGYIVAGHGRLEAAKALGLTEVPVDYQEFQSEEAEYAFLVSDNAVALWAELDLAGINADLPDLGPDFNIDMLGIKDFQLDPNFEPGTIDEQGRLDQKKPTTCPACGESFVAS
jgi:hypothetical protein